MPEGRMGNLLRVLIAALVMIATIMLAVGERSIVMTVVTLVAVVVSAYVTDAKHYFSLRQGMANFAAVAVVALAIVKAYQTDRAGLISVAAALQSHLQYVLLFQPKTVRVYWQLALLSLGQVAIASTLVAGPTFGVLLLIFLLVGIVAFILLLLGVETNRFARPQSPPVAAAIAGAPVLWGAVAPVHSRMFGRGLLEHAMLIGLTALLVGGTMFLSLPRWTIVNREVATNEPLRTVGFSRTVTLGELGDVTNNSDVVMRVTFFRGRSSQPFRLVNEPLFRGTVITEYAHGRWVQNSGSSPIRLQVQSKSPFVRQHFKVEAVDAIELFAVFPVFAIESDERLRVDAITEQLMRFEDYREEVLEFEVGTNGIVDGRQREFVPCADPLDELQIPELLQMPKGSTPQGAFPVLRATAARVLSEQGIDPRERVAAAAALSNYLRASGEYFYSLEPQKRDAGVDPLEDFISTHKVGHCEYFAGALVMMLRSVGIPARMAIGFKGGEWNPLGMYYQVQQLHAHAWVEVYLAEDNVPPEAFTADDVEPRAAWLVLDPTEGTLDTGLSGRRGIWARVRQSMDYGQVLWANYVVGLNSQRQRQGIYEPLAQGLGAAVENITSPQIWQARFQALANSPVGTFWDWYRRHWFSWRGGLVAVGFGLALLACYLAVRGMFVLLRRWGLVRGVRQSQEPPVLEMYRRLEAALARQGLTRRSGQTPYEFAQFAGGDLAETIELRAVAHLPRRVVEAFYRVRFGGRTLDNVEAEAVEHALTQLELLLGQTR